MLNFANFMFIIAGSNCFTPNFEEGNHEIDIELQISLVTRAANYLLDRTNISKNHKNFEEEIGVLFVSYFFAK